VSHAVDTNVDDASLSKNHSKLQTRIKKVPARNFEISNFQKVASLVRPATDKRTTNTNFIYFFVPISVENSYSPKMNQKRANTAKVKVTTKTLRQLQRNKQPANNDNEFNAWLMCHRYVYYLPELMRLN
jgi:hypothetical protein